MEKFKVSWDDWTAIREGKPNLTTVSMMTHFETGEYDIIDVENEICDGCMHCEYPEIYGEDTCEYVTADNPKGLDTEQQYGSLFISNKGIDVLITDERRVRLVKIMDF